MKQFYLLSTLLCALAISNPVSAQITIDEVKTDPSERILKNEVRPTTVDAQSYFSRARYRAERAAIRKERNTLEFGGGILGSVASYSDSWIETSGGDNSIGLAATLFLHHTFTKQRFTIETKFDAKFGYNRMNIEVAGDGGSTTSEATWYKNQDEFQISTNPAYIINKSWQVGSIIKFRSQFATVTCRARSRRPTIGKVPLCRRVTSTYRAVSPTPVPSSVFRSRSTSRRSP